METGFLNVERANGMSWSRWYSLRSYLRSSLWVVPFIALFLYLGAIRMTYVLDAWVDWTPLLPWGLSGTEKILETIVTIMLTFIVFTFGSLLVAIQIAGGQLTPRIIAATLLGDNAIRFTVGLFIFTLLFAAGALARLETGLRPGAAIFAAVLGFCSIAAFLYLIDYAARLLRPVSILWRVGEDGSAVIADVYPEEARVSSPAPRPQSYGSLYRTILHKGQAGIIIAVNLDALVLSASEADVLVELVPRVGDFVEPSAPLFRIYGTGVTDDRKLTGAVAFGLERTLEQDAGFAFRIVVDIGIKALSKAINDPTTAVLAIDQLERLLREVGKRHLHDEELKDRSGHRRVIYRTPNWEGYVEMSFSEMRLYGAENFQVSRRLRAMIDSLLETLPEFRHAALKHERDLLDLSLSKVYLLPDDILLASKPDPQGIGR